MADNAVQLLKTRRFLPLFVTQFLGAMNDNLFKQALVILITYRLAAGSANEAQLLVTIAAGVFILPFFLFSATAGQIADRFEKSFLIRLTKFCEILIMALATAGFYFGEPYFLLAVLFLMGTQSSFFGPLKYGILPDHLGENQLVAGNALIEGGTFLAILIGSIVGGLIVLNAGGTAWVSALVLCLALAGWLASRRIPEAPAAAPELKVNLNVVAETVRIVRFAADKRAIFLSILGLSWFWMIGATFLAQFPSYTKGVLGADETVVTLFMAVFTIGIGLGSILCERLLKDEISAKYVPFGAIGISLFTLDLFFASGRVAAPGADLVGALAFAGDPAGWRILADLFLIAASGGLYSVPLYAILQHDAEAAHRSRTIAANNIVNAAFIVAGAAVVAGLLALGWTIPQLFLAVAAVNLVVAAYIVRLVPEGVIKAVLVSILKLFYRVEVRGIENYRAAGERAVIVVNHVSFLDGLLIATFLPKKPVFAVATEIAKKWWMRPLMALAEAFPLDPANPLAMKSLVKLVRGDRHCVIFPEGRITVTGSLMKINEGPGLIAEKSDAMVLPVRIDGAEYTRFSRLGGILRRRRFPKVTLTILPPRKFEVPGDLTGRARRQAAGDHLYNIMTSMMFETCNADQTLFDALLEAQSIHGGKRPVIEDVEREPMTYNRLVLGAHVLGRRLARLSAPRERVGVLLPNAAATVVTFFALQAIGRVPAMLNFSTGAANMIAAIKAAEIETVLASKRFVEAGGLADTVAALGQHANIVYLEDLRAQVSPIDKLVGLVKRAVPLNGPRRLGVTPNDPAVVLFTSGSEGTPKGVVLSHKNVLANRYQLAARVDFNPTDTVFNALPIFHSFGLTGGLLLPVLSGLKTFLYPSPLHYRIVPALIYDSNATIVFGTDTFLAGYAKAAHPYDFYAVRYIFAGAERVKDETRELYAEKFGVRVLEGYGATETSPVLAVNTPMHYRSGTVGRFLPGIDYTLEPVPGIERGGKLVVTGPNIMLGYLRAENPGVLEPPDGGRYDTGDIVDVDVQGYVIILGRAKRFAKIAGEMVSLTAVEGHAAQLWPDSAHAVVSVPDARKGEQLVLVTENAAADRAELLDHFRANGVPELMAPRTIQVVDKIPVLGTGKTDYVGVARLAAAASA